jgi:hypothetical protein
MESRETRDACGSFFARETTRRRLAMAVGAFAAVGVTPWPTRASQTATPRAEVSAARDQKVIQLLALSKELCGGGTFDEAGAEQLLQLLSDDASLAPGLEELFGVPVGELPPAMLATVSTNADVATKAILYYWYTAIFNGKPIPNRAARYTNLLTWQALYTPSWAVCKVYGDWANPPSAAPQVAAIPPLAIPSPESSS